MKVHLLSILSLLCIVSLIFGLIFGLIYYPIETIIVFCIFLICGTYWMIYDFFKGLFN